ncbi:MAG TPA: mersacidin/lichenicidin family type 2 lantibiotic [Ktedonobacteraceae bacterium]
MKFDVVRAWKDENYRQLLNEEELHTVPANPAGELNENELADIHGGDSPNLYGLSSAVATSSQRFHTLAGVCDINLFSAFLPISAFPRLINIAKSEKQVCGNEG